MLIKCEDCGKDVSDKAAACPNCACPVPKTASRLASVNSSNLVECGACSKPLSKNATICTNCGSKLCVEPGCTNPAYSEAKVQSKMGGALGGLIGFGIAKVNEKKARQRCLNHQK
jgi:hypothetical protein